jgi:hypothetical protein
MATATKIDEQAGEECFGPARLPRTLFVGDGGHDLIVLVREGWRAWRGEAVRNDRDGVPTCVGVRLAYIGPAAWEITMREGSAGGGVHGLGAAVIASCDPFMGTATIDFGAAGSKVYGFSASTTVSE